MNLVVDNWSINWLFVAALVYKTTQSGFASLLKQIKVLCVICFHPVLNCLTFYVQVCARVYLCVARLSLYPDVLPPLICPVNRSSYPNISFSCSPGIPAKKNQKKRHFTSRAGDLSWQDIIGLQSTFHRKFNAWHTIAPGLVRHADGDGDGAAVLSYPSLSVAFAKGTCRKP